MRIKKVSGTAVLQGNVVDSLDGNSTTNAPSIRAVNEGLGNIKGKILWTNPNPTANMSNGAEVNLSDDDYDYLEFIFLTSPSRNTYVSRIIHNINNKSEIDCVFNDAGSLFGGSRLFNFSTKTKLIFETSYGMNISAHSGYGQHSNWLIPYQIIGYKTGLFS